MNAPKTLSGISRGLKEGSRHYHSEDSLYETFSLAEDAPGLIYKYLIPFIKNKIILDVGCGTGKYCKLFFPHAKSIVGLDNSKIQLKIAKVKLANLKNIKLKHVSAEVIPFENNTFDLVFASWFLGVIQKEKQQKQILEECFRVLKPGGKMILIENAEGSEFEFIRGRVNDPTKRTRAYNEFLLKMGFKINKKISTYFLFKNKNEALKVIGGIWSEKAEAKVKKSKIEHKIVIFSKDKLLIKR